jgi:hypothetical protein
MRWAAFGLLLVLVGCMSAPVAAPPLLGGASGFLPSTSAVASVDPMLSWVGGLCIITGVISWVVTRSYGLRAILVGIGLVLLNQAMARFGNWLFVPTLAATGAISLTYAFVTIRRMLRLRKGEA